MATANLYTCSRCGGSGKYSFNLMHGTKCYGCNGTGKQKTKPATPTPKWAVFGNGVRLYNVTAKTESEAIAKAVKTFAKASHEFKQTNTMEHAVAIKFSDMTDASALTLDAATATP